MNTTQPQNPLEAVMMTLQKCQMRESSLQAYKDVQSDKQVHYKEILKALERIGKSATAKTIASYCNLSYHQVSRRTKEMEDLKLIKVVGRCLNTPRRPMLWDIF